MQMPSSGSTYLGFAGGSLEKNLPVNTGDMGFIPGSEGFPWIWEKEPTPVFLLGNNMDRGAWWATVHRVAKTVTT